MSKLDFQAVYLACWRSVYRYAYALTRNRHEAEDLAQEAFVRFLRTKDSFRGECRETTWLCQTVKNLWIDQCRKAKGKTSTELTERDGVSLTLSGATLEERAIDRDKSQQILRYLQEMPEPYREVFTLRVMGELPFAQIGLAFGRSEGWARVVYYRAKQRLREQLEKGDAQE